MFCLTALTSNKNYFLNSKLKKNVEQMRLKIYKNLRAVAAKNGDIRGGILWYHPLKFHPCKRLYFKDEQHTISIRRLTRNLQWEEGDVLVIWEHRPNLLGAIGESGGMAPSTQKILFFSKNNLILGLFKGKLLLSGGIEIISAKT